MAPPLYPNLGDKANYCTIKERQDERETEAAITDGWLYDPQFSQMYHAPFATTQVLLVIRMFRDPAKPGYTQGLEKLLDDMKKQALED